MIEELQNAIFLELSTKFLFRYNVQKMHYGKNLALSVARKCRNIRDEDEVIIVFTDTGVFFNNYPDSIEYTTSSILDDIIKIAETHLGQING